jgi:hypothetical protein
MTLKDLILKFRHFHNESESFKQKEIDISKQIEAELLNSYDYKALMNLKERLNVRKKYCYNRDDIYISMKKYGFEDAEEIVTKFIAEYREKLLRDAEYSRNKL